MARRLKPDYQRIHELEFDLGLRDDPPPPTDAPGAMIRYRGIRRDGTRGVVEIDRSVIRSRTPASSTAVNAILKDFYAGR